MENKFTKEGKEIREHLSMILAEDIASEIEGVDEGKLYAELMSLGLPWIARANMIELEHTMDNIAKDELYNTIVEKNIDPNVPEVIHTEHTDESYAVVEQVAELLYSIYFIQY